MSADEPFELVVTPPAARALQDQLPEPVAAAVIEFLITSLISPRAVWEPAARRVGGIWSARRGTYRILYRLRENPREVIVLRIEHRRGVYRPADSIV